MEKREVMAALNPPEGAFALRVQGTSMIGDHINDGDIVVIDPNREPAEGDIVAAEVDGKSTLKRYFPQPGGRVRLQPANDEVGPIYVEPSQVLRIRGVVCGVLRCFPGTPSD